MPCTFFLTLSLVIARCVCRSRRCSCGSSRAESRFISRRLLPPTHNLTATLLLAGQSIQLRELCRAKQSPAEMSEVENNDYTEGASAIDIQSAMSESRGRSRRLSESQIGFSYGEGAERGSVFDGPGHVAIPSSVSRMNHREMSHGRSQELRRMSSDFGAGNRHVRHFRRRSEDSVHRSPISRRSTDDLSIGSVEGEEEESGEDGDLGLHTRRRRRRRSPSPPEAMRSSVFENIANLFSSKTHGHAESSSRRPSFSHRSSISRRSRRSRSGSRASLVGSEHAIESEDEEERWGYSSGEEDDNSSSDDLLIHRHGEGDLGESSDMDYGSLPPSPRGSLPNMALDPIFGDTRIEMDAPPEPPGPPPPGPPSRQTIFLPDEEITIRFIGYETIHWRQTLWRVGCIFTFGLLGLLGHWFPRLWLRWVAQEKAFKDSDDGFIVVEVYTHASSQYKFFLTLRVRRHTGISPCFPSKPSTILTHSLQHFRQKRAMKTQLMEKLQTC